MFLKKESIFFVRGCLARTAEFWNCKAYSALPVLFPAAETCYFRAWK